MQMDRKPNPDTGKKIEGVVIHPEAIGVYEVSNPETKERGAMICFEKDRQRIQFVVHEEDLDVFVIALTEIQAVIADHNKPNPKEMN